MKGISILAKGEASYGKGRFYYEDTKKHPHFRIKQYRLRRNSDIYHKLDECTGGIDTNHT